MNFRDYSDLFMIEKGFTALNHGSYGAVPGAILEYQYSLINRMESLTTRFFTRELSALLEGSLSTLCDFINTPYESTVFIKNATTAANAVLKSVPFEKGDEVVTTNLIYASCRKALDHITSQKGVKVHKVEIPFPAKDKITISNKIMEKVNERTKLIFIDHITSETATIMPVEMIIEAASKLGIEVFVDGAHAPGMIPLDISKLKPDYYTGNCHKWLYTPKGSAFLYVNPQKFDQMVPTVISNHYNDGATPAQRFRNSFDWSATMDYSGYACVGKTIKYLEKEVEGGWEEIRKRNHALVLKGRDILTEMLNLSPTVPDEMTGSIVTMKLGSKSVKDPATGLDVVQVELLDRYKIEALITTLYPTDERIIRISAALYNNEEDYVKLGEALSGCGY
jgi:isopenicillin-N epimerase